jgi:hypothetical protein
MARLFVSGAMLAAMLGGADAHVRFAADYSVQPYLDNGSLGVRHGPPVYVPSRQDHGPPVSQPPVYRPPLPRVPDPATPVPRHELASPPPPRRPIGSGREVHEPVGAKTGQAPTPEQGSNQPTGAPVSNSPLMAFLLLVLTAGCVAAAAAKPNSGWRAAASDGRRAPPQRDGLERPSRVAPTRSGSAMDASRRAASAAAETGFPSQEGWAQRAGKVRNPLSGFAFRFQARANARAMEEEQKRMQKARGMTKEYTGMLKDLAEGEEAATAYAVRRELAGDFYEHELLKQQEQFEEASHKRRLSGKRRDRELTEADTRRIEAVHEREATEKFKDAKFALGLARFAEKQKGHEVGTASADAAIAETKAPAAPTSGTNESAEVLQLYALLQSTMAAIEEGERVGRDTQALRERRDAYKKLLNLS